MIVMRHGDRMTLTEYRLTPENDGVWDLIDGVLEKQPLATVVHQMILGELLMGINGFAADADPPLGCGISNVGVAFSETFAPTPDIVYVCADQFHLMHGSFVEGIPDLLVEVLSEDRDRDLIRKTRPVCGSRGARVLDSGPGERGHPCFYTIRQGIHRTHLCSWRYSHHFHHTGIRTGGGEGIWGPDPRAAPRSIGSRQRLAMTTS